ncbi:MAG: hypothetical protein ACOCP4_05225 [Candidatus Woesearchaeota archaeon]
MQETTYEELVIVHQRQQPFFLLCMKENCDMSEILYNRVSRMSVMFDLDFYYIDTDQEPKIKEEFSLEKDMIPAVIFYDGASYILNDYPETIDEEYLSSILFNYIF